MPETRGIKRARPGDESPDSSPLSTIFVSESDLESTLSDLEDFRIKRSEAVWYDDGNVILQVGDTRFRVHKSILSAQSRVFRERFLEKPEAKKTKGKPGGGRPRRPRFVDGVEVVRLEGDSVQDWTYVLQIVYDGHRTYRSDTSYPFSVVRAMLTLGDKYGFEYLRSQAVYLYEKTFPSDFSTFSGIYYSPSTNMKMTEKWIRMDARTTLVDVADMANLFGLIACLPAIYYLVVSQKDFMSCIATGFAREDGTRAIFSRDFIQILLSGREKLITAAARKMFNWLWSIPEIIPAAGSCKDKISCRNSLREIHAKYWWPSFPPSKILGQWNTRYAQDLCPACAKVAQAEFCKGQKEVRKDLPGFFGLSAWEELQNRGRA
ncbi:hypothetical protein CC1G_03065 [Coprinopsis cinerea okayama7|uniref:BTB domain-containing protein n=1 Tax=Coprinopsis cinerea (strain Okayama-7 / 130 / ATCC MYA-4618 / FGSC 9003) TaxID=240176 RepID=A8PES7_COPC7|nr:hypothetical protein CC1G_03065 [Coprinopsis cinerea okayama7\|eukprot:XP_001840836.1 hypothetical protein CC1G_03065 [Coprinopsis cinerea okayama7\